MIEKYSYLQCIRPYVGKVVGGNMRYVVAMEISREQIEKKKIDVA